MTIEVPYDIQVMMGDVGTTWLAEGRLDDECKAKECLMCLLDDIAGNETFGDTLIITSIESLAALHSFAETQRQMKGET